mgnify:CR=1 FL=1
MDAQATPTPFVEFQNVWLAYNEALWKQGQFAVENINLQVQRGEFIGHSRDGTAREQLHRLFRCKLLQIVMQPRQQRDHRDHLPPGPTRHMPDLGWKEHHVQNHSVVGPVRGVAMGNPIRSTQVKFNIAR